MRARVLLALTFLGLTAARAMAADALLVGTPTVSPSPLVPGAAAEVVVTLRAVAKKATAPVQLEVYAGKAAVGKLADAPLGANQSKTYRIPIKVPADAAKGLDLKIVGWGAELGHVSVAVKPPPASAPATTGAPPAGSRPPLPSLTQTVTTGRATMTGNRGQQGAPPPPPSITQTVNTAPTSMTGNRGQQPIPPPPPSITQTVNTPSATMTGNR